MKDGDKLLELIRRRNLLWNWFLAVYSLEYVPDWLYWYEWVIANEN